MGGVDLADQRMKYYNSDRKTLKWTSKNFFWHLDMRCMNAHLLFSESKSEMKKDFLQFKQHLIDLLLEASLIHHNNATLSPHQVLQSLNLSYETNTP